MTYALVACLLEQGEGPLHIEINSTGRQDTTLVEDPLDFSVGAVFLFDPAGKVVGFAARDLGVLAKFPC